MTVCCYFFLSKIKGIWGKHFETDNKLEGKKQKGGERSNGIHESRERLRARSHEKKKKQAVYAFSITQNYSKQKQNFVKMNVPLVFTHLLKKKTNVNVALITLK